MESGIRVHQNCYAQKSDIVEADPLSHRIILHYRIGSGQ